MTNLNYLQKFSVITFVSLAMLVGITSVVPVFAADNPYLGCPDCNGTNNVQQIQLTSSGTLQIGFSTDPINPNTSVQTHLQINFINKQNSPQQHIDYKVSVMQAGNQVFGTPITHTAIGSVSIPFQFQTAGTYQVIVEVDGILFQPIPPETTIFSISSTGNSQNQATTQTPSLDDLLKKRLEDAKRLRGLPDGQNTTTLLPSQPSSNNSTGNPNNPYVHIQNQTTPTTIPTTPAKIPNWVKAVFGYYAQGNLSDADLINALQFLIQQGIIKLN